MKLGLLSIICATHPHNTHVDTHTLCLLPQLALVWSPRKLCACLPTPELISAKEKSGPVCLLHSGLVQLLGTQTASLRSGLRKDLGSLSFLVQGLCFFWVWHEEPT